MKMVIVADTGPLVALAVTETLTSFLQLGFPVAVPHAVMEEATRDPVKPGAQAIRAAVNAGQITVETVSVVNQESVLKATLDPGEIEAIVLCQLREGVLLIDERLGRKAALGRKLPVIGTLGVLEELKKQGRITALKPLIMELRQHGYRLSDTLVNEMLRRCGE